jgi:hypothetical protein
MRTALSPTAAAELVPEGAAVMIRGFMGAMVHGRGTEVAALRARGFKVRRLEDGYPEWKAAGLPVESLRAA